MRRFTVRTRIAVAAGLLVAALLGAVAAVLAVQAGSVGAGIAQAAATADLAPYATDLRMQPGERPDVPSPGVLVQVVDPSGRVVRDSLPAGLALPSGTGVTGGYAVVTQQVATATGTWQLTAARSTAAASCAADAALVVLAVAAPLVAAGTGLGAWLIAGVALRPVERMRRTAERLRASDGEEVLPVGRGDDELVRLARTLNDLLAGLRAGVAHERRLTADASHELRTPIAVLAAQAELASSPPTEEDLDGIRRSAERLSRLADDLLLLSRPAAAAPPTPVAALVTEAMDAVDRARLLAAPGVLVDLELGPLDEATACRIAPVAFARVLTNLLANATAKTEHGAVVVRLVAVDGLLLEVADTGPGVPADFLARAFDRFSRPPGDGGSGAGLGLAVVQRLVLEAGGAVSLDNRPGGGAVAAVRLPADPAGGAPAERTLNLRDLETPTRAAAPHPAAVDGRLGTHRPEPARSPT